MQATRVSLLNTEKSFQFSDHGKDPDLEIWGNSHSENQLWYFERGQLAIVPRTNIWFLTSDILVPLARDLQPDCCYKLTNVKLVHRALDLSGGDQRAGRLLALLNENKTRSKHSFRSHRLGSTWR